MRAEWNRRGVWPRSTVRASMSPTDAGFPRAALLAAYRATGYVLSDGEAAPNARIGMASAGLDELLERHEADSGTFVTAWNPGSRSRSDAEHRAPTRGTPDTPALRAHRNN